MKTSRVVFLVFLITLSLCVVYTQHLNARSRTIVVPRDYSTIQDAIDGASAGDTVFVKSGTYSEQTLIINKPLSLIGEDGATAQVNPTSTFSSAPSGRTIVTLAGNSLAKQTNSVYSLGSGASVYNFIPPPTYLIKIASNNVTVSGLFLVGATYPISGSGNNTRIINNYIATISYYSSSVVDDGITLRGSNNSIIGNVVTGAANDGIRVSGQFNNISNNIVYSTSFFGILVSGNFNTISNNSLRVYAVGIYLSSVDRSTVNDNILTRGTDGIVLGGKHNDYNMIFKNRVEGSTLRGVIFHSASHNVFFDNYVANNVNPSNEGYGISLSGSDYHAENNTFYHNDFIGNTHNFRVEQPSFNNSWDNGAHGNFWSNYTTRYPNATEIDSTGIGNTPYVLDANNTDLHPLISPCTNLSRTQRGVPPWPKTTPMIPPNSAPISQSPSGSKTPTYVPPKLATSYPLVAMPDEYINYTISRVNERLWATVDGTYPLHVINNSQYQFLSNELPMVYPTPPGTTNISVKISGTELTWGNYTQSHPGALHYTAIGNWTMINCTIAPVPSFFILSIHYEHPIEVINGSYTFLYDLNISPYLTGWNTKSTAYFKIRVADYENLRIYTVGSEPWTPINYTVAQEDTAKTVNLQILSEYQQPLPGDLLVKFTDPQQASLLGSSLLVQCVYIIVSVLAVGVATPIGYLFLKRRNKGGKGK